MMVSFIILVAVLCLLGIGIVGGFLAIVGLALGDLAKDIWDIKL